MAAALNAEMRMFCQGKPATGGTWPPPKVIISEGTAIAVADSERSGEDVGLADGVGVAVGAGDGRVAVTAFIGKMTTGDKTLGGMRTKIGDSTVGGLGNNRCTIYRRRLNNRFRIRYRRGND